jgi:LuxR family maltose regulon positive regulatory protein
MDGPLLASKLHAPARRAPWVQRSRLIDRLAAPRRLVLIAAPAGFGKTSVLTEWLSQAEGSVAWLALDERDNDDAVFWTYLLAALDRACRALPQRLPSSSGPGRPATRCSPP